MLDESLALSPTVTINCLVQFFFCFPLPFIFVTCHLDAERTMDGKKLVLFTPGPTSFLSLSLGFTVVFEMVSGYVRTYTQRRRTLQILPRRMGCLLISA
jgi:hypothetical protein